MKIKTRIRKTGAFLLSLCLFAASCSPDLSAVQADSTAKTVEISSAEDFFAFAENCSLDTWSRGKTFVLTADLDLTGRSFAPIPTFGGTFLGNGHSILGVFIDAVGSDMGLFRFVQEGAVIRDLHVSGRIVPGGSAVNTGGIAGSNAGFIQNCSFRGTVKGTTNVGGIAGENQISGELSGCLSDGTISGENSTGGIAGRSFGLILKCENRAAVNTSSPDEALSGSALEQIPSIRTEEEAEGVLNSHTDTGGIAGYSEGIIQSCSNAGTVGYSHVGYNIGGIAGRQAGYAAGCENRAGIYGRKDVGGIVGQAEPDIVLNTDGDTLTRLRQELNTLSVMIEDALDHTDAGQSDISQKLTAVINTTENAKDYARTLMEQTQDFADDNIEALNTLSVAVTNALDGLVPALDSLSGASEGLEDLGMSLSLALDTLAASAPLADKVLADAKSAVSDLQSANTSLAGAVREMRAAADDLQQAVIIHDREAVKAANKQLSLSFRDLGNAFQGIQTALNHLEAALNSTIPGAEEAMNALRDLASAAGGAGTALGEIGTAMGTISDNTEISWETVQTALDAASNGFDHLEDASQQMNSAMERLNRTLTDASPLTDALGSSAGQFSDAAGDASWAAGRLEDAFRELEDAADQLARDGDIQFESMGQEARHAADGLYASLSDLSDGITDLQASMDSAGDALSADLRDINRQTNKIVNLMLDAADSAQTVGTSEDLFGDVSEKDIDGTRTGKISACVNTGNIEGDRNVGGIAGAVAVEYSLDPEDDYSRLSFGSTYELKAILQNCVSSGAVTGKRDCVGGIAGRMDLGTAIGCESRGMIRSGGSYAGGIAGYADAAIRKSWAKCTLAGTKYIGGIAGWASRMSGCRSITVVSEGTECVGSIAGDADLEDGGLEDNWFLETGPAGIDGVSYQGIAEPVSFDRLSGEKDAPSEFLSFTLTLTADGEITAEIPFQFGDDLRLINLPEVPPKEGFYGTWPGLDSRNIYSDLTLEAVYTPWVTMAASEETDGKRALALAEGQFTEEVCLHVQSAGTPPPEGEKDADVWEVTLTRTNLSEDDRVPIRLLNRRGKHAVVWQLTDGQWQKADASVNGSYLCLVMNGTSGVFAVCPSSGAYAVLLPAAAGIIILAAAVLLFRKAGRRMKSHRTKKG